MDGLPSDWRVVEPPASTPLNTPGSKPPAAEFNPPVVRRARVGDRRTGPRRRLDAVGRRRCHGRGGCGRDRGRGVGGPVAGRRGPPAASRPRGSLVVDVGGAVRRPGVYRLVDGARVGDAIEAAGGFAPTVDAAVAARDLNLAARLEDGDRVRVPARGRDQPPTTGTGAGGAAQRRRLPTPATASSTSTRRRPPSSRPCPRSGRRPPRRSSRRARSRRSPASTTCGRASCSAKRRWPRSATSSRSAECPGPSRSRSGRSSPRWRSRAPGPRRIGRLALLLAPAAVLIAIAARRIPAARPLAAGVAGAAVIALRVLVLPLPRPALDLPDGSGPWPARVESVSSPREGHQRATIALLVEPVIRVALDAPRYPPIQPGDRIVVQRRGPAAAGR